MMNKYMKISKFVFIGVVFLFSLFVSHKVYAVLDNSLVIERLFIDKNTISKGYTLVAEEGRFKVGVIPYSISEPVLVVAKKIPESHFPEGVLEKSVSEVYEYDIRKIKKEYQGIKTKASEIFLSDTDSLGSLEKPIYVALKFNSNSLNKKIVYFWNKPTSEWIPLPTTTDFKNNLARAVIHLPYARLAVFESSVAYEGAASWYAYKDCFCAASTIYPKGTKVKVTNIHPTSKKLGKSIIVRINDYGPDPNIHPDRVIDLDKIAFSDLATSLGSGLMMVRVEKVN